MDRTAIIIDNTTQTRVLHYSYGELLERVTALAKSIHLLLAGREPACVGVFCENSLELVVSILAVFSTAHSYVPLNTRNTSLVARLSIPLVIVSTELFTEFLTTDPISHFSAINTQLAHYNIVILYSPPVSHNRVSTTPPEGLSLYNLVYNSLQCIPLSATPSQKIAYVLQTSGTTGLPKLISVPHSCLIPNILDLSRVFSLSPSDICVLTAPPTFDPSLVQVLTSLYRGCTLLIGPCTPSLLTRHSVTVLQCTPSHFRSFPLLACQSLLGVSSCLRVLAFGGEVCPPPSLLRRWRHPDNHTDLYNVYGITEVSCWATCHKIQLDNTRTDGNVLTDAVPIGEALSETRVELRGREGEEEIWVGGSNRRCEVEGDERGDMRNTGDIGARSSDGVILCVGRRDEQFKRLGCRVNLLSMERELRQLSGISDCVVTRERGDVVVAYVETEGDSDLIEVRRRVQTCVASRYRPDILRNMSRVPLTAHGKLDFSSLLQLSSRHAYTEISSAVEEFFENEFSLLSLSSSSSSLSQLGLDSFELVAITNRLQDILSNYSLNVSDVFDSCYDFLSSHPTQHLTHSTIQAIQRYSSYPPSPKRTRVLSPLAPLVQALPTLIISLSRGRVSCPVDTLPYCLLPPPTAVSLIPDWSHDTGRCVDSSPLLCYHPVSQELTVYAGSHSHLFSAVRGSDGVCLWSRQLDDRVESTTVLSHCGCYLVVGSYSGRVWVLEREGGEVHWSYSTGSEPVKSSPCVDPLTGLVWVGTHNHSIVALEVSEKRCVFSVGTESGSCYSSPVPNPNTGSVYVGTHGGDLLSVSGRSGALEWRRNLGGPIFSSPSILPNDSVVVGTVGHKVCCVDRDGVVLWSYATSSPVFSSPCILGTNRGVLILIGTYDKSLLCLDSSGELEWRTVIECEMYSIPFALPCNHYKPGGVIAAALNDGTVILLDITGTKLCSYKLPAEIYSSPVLAGDQLFVGCRDNKLYCLKILTDRVSVLSNKFRPEVV